ncbi:hypothetical protein [Limosilactobacillus fermentum]|uniref:hypothetical protein n=1 Tax=Limosilactobacillus fermentum TaxID=1613 RepID=UPI00209C3281|nr:hypothetical protein [Limosilactobacillus fermentum]MCO8299440.1 hypothetical protein [Limosilactobacillus fermentum]
MKRNHNLIITSTETICVGLVMLFNQEMIRDDPHNLVVHSVHAFGQIPWVTVLLLVGSTSLLVALSGIQKWKMEFIATVVLGGLWASYSVVFLIQDEFFRPTVSVSTVLSGYVFIRILMDAFFNYSGGDHK